LIFKVLKGVASEFYLGMRFSRIPKPWYGESRKSPVFHSSTPPVNHLHHTGRSLNLSVIARNVAEK
jgi:hypothetical protein